MHLPKTKEEQRRELEQALQAYLQQGGQVEHVPSGISGRVDHNRALPHVFEKSSTPQTRTPLDSVVAAIEQRRKLRGEIAPARSAAAKKPRKKMIYDDFGQPLRWEWEES